MTAARRGASRTMHPAYFALVMATGIVSIACHLLGCRGSLRPLLCGQRRCSTPRCGCSRSCALSRFPRSRRRPTSSHHGRAVGFFTTVAATCVLGSQCVVIGGAVARRRGLWMLGIVLWAVVTYGVFTALTVKAEKPPLGRGHQRRLAGRGRRRAVGLACSARSSRAGFGASAPQVLFFCLCMWLGGGMLYIWIISLIFYRYTFFALSPSDLAPPYWINMGAVAISTLAGHAARRRRAALAAAARAAAVPQGLDAAVLGHRHLVDPDAGHPRRLAPRLSALSAPL